VIKFLDLPKQYLSIKSEIDEALAKVIDRAAFIKGDELSHFEESFARYHQCSDCVGVGNGTDALEISLEALNLPKGAEVIVPANTFIATSEAVSRSGYKVVFCDAREDDFTIDIESLKSQITEKTGAIIAVHLYGHPCHMDELMNIANKNDLKVIEDSAQAHGAEYRGKRIASIGHVATFSFFPGKNLGAYGDGGAIVTNDSDLAKKCRMIADHGRTAKYDHSFEGRNSRLDNLQAAVLGVKLGHLEKWTDARIQVADYYLENLADANLILPVRQSWARAVYHQFVIRHQNRDGLKKYLSEKGIPTGIHYPISLPKLEAYRSYGLADKEWAANRMDKDLLSLPIGEHLEETDLEFIVKTIKEF